MSILEKYSGIPKTTLFDVKSPFEVLFEIRPRFAIDPPQLEFVALNTNLATEFEVAISNSARVSRVVPRTAQEWTKKVEVGHKVIFQRCRKERGSKIESTKWFIPSIFKEENHPRYQLLTDDRRKFRRSVRSYCRYSLLIQ